MIDVEDFDNLCTWAEGVYPGSYKVSRRSFYIPNYKGVEFKIRYMITGELQISYRKTIEIWKRYASINTNQFDFQDIDDVLMQLKSWILDSLSEWVPARLTTRLLYKAIEVDLAVFKKC